MLNRFRRRRFNGKGWFAALSLLLVHSCLCIAAPQALDLADADAGTGHHAVHAAPAQQLVVDAHDCCGEELSPPCCDPVAEFIVDTLKTPAAPDLALQVTPAYALVLHRSAIRPRLERLSWLPPDNGPPVYLRCCAFLD